MQLILKHSHELGFRFHPLTPWHILLPSTIFLVNGLSVSDENKVLSLKYFYLGPLQYLILFIKDDHLAIIVGCAVLKYQFVNNFHLLYAFLPKFSLKRLNWVLKAWIFSHLHSAMASSRCILSTLTVGVEATVTVQSTIFLKKPPLIFQPLKQERLVVRFWGKHLIIMLTIHECCIFLKPKSLYQDEAATYLIR